MDHPESPSVSPDPRMQGGLTLADLAGSVLRQRTLATRVWLATILTAVVGASFWPKTYVASTTLLPLAALDASSGLLATLSSQMGAISGLVGGLPGDNSGQLLDLLESKTLASRVSDSLHLEQLLTSWHTRGELIDRIQEIVTVTPASAKTHVITIEVSARDPVLAARIANAYAEELQSFSRELAGKQTSRYASFIQSQLIRSKSALERAENELSVYQTKNHIASLPETVESSIKALGEIESRQVLAQVEIEKARQEYSDVESRMKSFTAGPGALSELAIKQKSLQAQNEALKEAHRVYASRVIGLPPKALAMARLQREVQIKNAIYVALSQQSATAILSERQESDTFVQLDKATAPDRPHSPKKLLIFAISIVFGAIVGIISATIRDLRGSKSWSTSSS